MKIYERQNFQKKNANTIKNYLVQLYQSLRKVYIGFVPKKNICKESAKKIDDTHFATSSSTRIIILRPGYTVLCTVRNSVAPRHATSFESNVSAGIRIFFLIIFSHFDLWRYIAGTRTQKKCRCCLSKKLVSVLISYTTSTVVFGNYSQTKSPWRQSALPVWDKFLIHRIHIHKYIYI